MGWQASGPSLGRSPGFQLRLVQNRLSTDLIDELAGPAVRLGADVVLPWDGRDHYLAGIYRTSLADRVGELVAAGERSMRALVNTVDTQRIVMDEQRSLTNVNTATDLSTALPPQIA